MSTTRPLPRRLDATDDDLARAHSAAHTIATATQGRDPGLMTTAASMSHYVYIGADVVVKLVDAGGHNRLDLEIALAQHLPTGLGAPLLASGRRRLKDCDVRYACFTRLPGTSPGVGLPDADAATARRWAEQAVQRLDALHTWTPTGPAEQALKQPPVHEGFTGRAALLDHIEGVLAADRDTVIPRTLTTGLTTIAQNAPLHAEFDTPVHADCDWGNWLADDQNVTALLDFERARFGAPADDWVLLAATSGPHIALVLDVIAEQTASSPEILRAACELRDAAFLAEDLRYALELPAPPPWMARRVRELEGLVLGQRWWQPAGPRRSP
ncbi:hypothetical protein HDA40_001902 [Hamadaea flava]|uniref:Phosphotransferase family protein n=1 Tax=Hamadaea flava TaxID=1742688 RepID=A0ABV8LEV5_9ACTN|nr:phosphotransferase [Hamadaea flava]MCP2323395.1 hypothetical protein [Hamadaea flava]